MVNTLCVAFCLRANSAELYPIAPLFSLTDISGQKLELSSYRGRVVVLNFWASWCGPCREEIPGLVELQTRYESQGLVVIGLTVDDRLESVRHAERELGINYPLALADNDLGPLYGSGGVPTTFVLGRDGRIYSKHSGVISLGDLTKEVAQLLASSITREPAKFEPAGKVEPIELPSAGELNREVPGVDISKLNTAELTTFKNQLEKEQCDCDCKRNILKCLKEHFGCNLSRKLAKAELKDFPIKSQP
jgi:cytochrome c biogenesis protein CcmG, thiol:disulfide interchange protein DsbE